MEIKALTDILNNRTPETIAKKAVSDVLLDHLENTQVVNMLRDFLAEKGWIVTTGRFNRTFIVTTEGLEQQEFVYRAEAFKAVLDKVCGQSTVSDSSGT